MSGLMERLSLLEATWSILGWAGTILMTLFVIPWLRRIHRKQQEQSRMIGRKLFENTDVVIYGVFGQQLQSDVIGTFLTTFFGNTIFDLIISWNDATSPDVIVPPVEAQAKHLEETLIGRASSHLVPAAWLLQPYFRDVQAYGTEDYRYMRMVLGVLRPDAEKLEGPDQPRLAIVEEGTLRRILRDEIQPQWQTPDARVWLEAVRELARHYDQGKRGIAVLEMPIPASCLEEAATPA